MRASRRRRTSRQRERIPPKRQGTRGRWHRGGGCRGCARPRRAPCRPPPCRARRPFPANVVVGREAAWRSAVAVGGAVGCARRAAGGGPRAAGGGRRRGHGPETFKLARPDWFSATVPLASGRIGGAGGITRQLSSSYLASRTRTWQGGYPTAPCFWRFQAYFLFSKSGCIPSGILQVLCALEEQLLIYDCFCPRTRGRCGGGRRWRRRLQQHTHGRAAARGGRRRRGGTAPLLLLLMVMMMLLLLPLPPARPARPLGKISSPSHWSSHRREGRVACLASLARGAY